MLLAAAIAGGGVAAGVTLAILHNQARTNKQQVDLGSHVTIVENDAVIQVAGKALPAVVSIVTGDQSGRPVSGSGFVATSDGYVVTAVRVITGASNLMVLAPGQSQAHPARVVDYDCETGVAVLKVDGVSGLPTLAFGDSNTLRTGETVIAVGGPLAQRSQVTHGIVSGLHGSAPLPDPLDSTKQVTISDIIETDAGISAGQAGGPLLNVGGQVMGVVLAPSPAQGPGLALASADLQAEVSQIITTGQLTVAGLGVDVSDRTQAEAAMKGTAAGALVTGVTAAGPGDTAGIKVGDVITQVDDTVIDDAHPLAQVLRAQYTAGQRVTVTFSRGGSSSQVQLVLVGGRPLCS